MLSIGHRCRSQDQVNIKFAYCHQVLRFCRTIFSHFFLFLERLISKSGSHSVLSRPPCRG